MVRLHAAGSVTGETLNEFGLPLPQPVHETETDLFAEMTLMTASNVAASSALLKSTVTPWGSRHPTVADTTDVTKAKMDSRAVARVNKFSTSCLPLQGA
jgi:hypothetical protein